MRVVLAIAACTVLMFSQTSGRADAAPERAQVTETVSDDVSSHRKRKRRSVAYRLPLGYFYGPEACDAVVFPRSLLCEQPPTFLGLRLPLWEPFRYRSPYEVRP
jgi:hypothetical protein